ncbi:MAG TPA: hypothetical protein VNC40_10125 [Gaiellaceae bacterium]|nr:hypothetical protein [Gaiellaceae bacterium]
MLALGAIGAIVAYAGATGGRLAPLADGAGTLGLALLTVAIVLRLPAVVPWAIIVTAGGYLAGREGRALVDGWAAVVGVLLLLAAELALWSIDHDDRIRAERSLTVRRVVTLTALTAAALLVNFGLLGAAAVAAPAGFVLATAGIAAAVTAVAVVLRLARA